MLTETQIAEVFRMLGYPNKGTAVPGNVGYPAFASALGMWQPFAVLENRLNTMTTDEEVTLFGAEHPSFGSYLTASSLAITFSTPSSIASTAEVILDADDDKVTVTAGAGATPATLAAAVASAINSGADISQALLGNAVGAQLALYARSLGTEGNGINVQAVSTDPSLLMQIGAASAAQFVIGMTSGGANPPGPYLPEDDKNQPTYGYVPIIRVLEGDLGTARENLDMISADVYYARQDEIAARQALLRRYRREMADRLNVPLDPDLLGNRSRRMRRIV